jgi:protein-tyrosine-phosphatase
MIQKSKQSTLAFRVSNKLKKQVESKCKSQGINVSNYLGKIFNEFLDNNSDYTIDNIKRKHNSLKNFENHKILSLALTLNKVNKETSSKIIDNYATLIEYFNEESFNSERTKKQPKSNDDLKNILNKSISGDDDYAFLSRIKKKRGRPSKKPAAKIKDVNNQVIFGGKTITLTAENIIKLDELDKKFGKNSAEYVSYLTDISDPKFSQKMNWDLHSTT